jgi:hypothetical protein
LSNPLAENHLELILDADAEMDSRCRPPAQNTRQELIAMSSFRMK